MITYTTSRGSKIEVNGYNWSANGKVVATTSVSGLKIVDGYMQISNIKIEVPPELVASVKAEHAAALDATMVAAEAYQNSFENQFDRLMSGKSNRLGIAN